MKLDLKSTNGIVVAMLLIAVAGVLFWMLAVSPKREEAAKLDKQIVKLESSLTLHEEEVLQGEEAKAEYPAAYQKLIVLGKAAPGEDDTASLIVQINRIAEHSKIAFVDIELEGNPSEEEAASVEGASPTEASAALLPLGAAIGPEGLAVMPYKVNFQGNYFELAKFIGGVDALVRTRNEDVHVNGRLITLDGFSLQESPEGKLPQLEGSFLITTFVTPPDQGVPAGSTAESPETAVATPASATIGGTP